MNAMTKVEEPTHLPTVRTVSPVGIFSDPGKFEFMQRAARVFAESDLVPPHMKGKLSNCLIALNIADRLQEDPLTVMQNIVVVSGRPGWMTAYMIARANRYGVFKGRISWRLAGAGRDMTVTAWARLAETEEEVSATTSMAMAEAEGWTKNAKYKSMPELMLRYRSAAMLIRLYCPEVMLGFPTVEEVETNSMVDVTPPRPPGPPPVVDHDPQTGEVTEEKPAGSPPRPPRPPRASKESPAAPAAVEEGPARNPAHGSEDVSAGSEVAPSTLAPPPKDADVSAWVAFAEAVLKDATAETVEDLWNEKVSPALDESDLFPGDHGQVIGVFDRRARELAP